jgi:hypothetical protein
MMTVGQLREQLDAFGDHLPVKLLGYREKDDEVYFDEFDVTDTTLEGEVTIVLEFDLPS